MRALALLVVCVSSLGCAERLAQPDAWTITDAGPTLDAADEDRFVAPSCACTTGPHNDFIYLLSDELELWTYDPRANEFAFVTGPICGGTTRPFSMAVDSHGVAWIEMVESLDLVTIDLLDLRTCDDPGYVRRDRDFGLFGMTFARPGGAAACEELFVHSYSGEGPFSEGAGLGALGAIDPATSMLRRLAATDYDGAELAGTGDGRLFAFAGVRPAKLVEYDPISGARLAVTPLIGVSKTNASAFAFFGGDVWLFTEAPPEGCDACFETTCASEHRTCLTSPDCTEQLQCAIERGDVSDVCGGGLPTDMQRCLSTCSGTCLTAPSNRVSRVTRLDFDDSEGGGLTIANEAAPMRVVGAGTSTCVPVGPF